MEAWCQVWNDHDKEKRDRRHAQYNAPDDKEFRLFQKKYGVSEEDVAELVGVDEYDSDLDDLTSKDL